METLYQTLISGSAWFSQLEGQKKVRTVPVKAVPAALVRIYYFVKTQIIILNPPPLALRV